MTKLPAYERTRLTDPAYADWRMRDPRYPHRAQLIRRWLWSLPLAVLLGALAGSLLP